MNAETINEMISVCQFVGTSKKNVSVDGDVVFQDIKPDILSIVKITRDICVLNKFVEENKVRVDGTVDVGIIYVADDETNSIKSVNTQIGFSEVIELQGVNESSIINLKTIVGSVEHRVINGRKVSIKVPVTFEISAFNNCDVNIIKGITNDANMQIQKTESVLTTSLMQNSTEIELKENVKLNEGMPAIAEILTSSINITNKEYKLSYNKILAKADANIRIIYIADNERQTIETFETTLPVMGFIEANNINENSNISLNYMIKSFSVRPVYQDLTANTVGVEAYIEVIAHSYESRNVELVTDFYSTNAVLKTENERMNVMKNLITHTEYIEFSQTLVVPELENTNILSIDGMESINEKNILNGKVAIAGNIDVNIFFNKKDSRSIENKRLDLPFQQVIKVEGINSNSNPIVTSSIESISYAVAGENQIQVNIKLVVEIVATTEEYINTVTKLEISDEAVPTMASIIIYYVKTGDTLWKIAKKFNNTVENIKEVNNLSEDTIYPGQRLLIPRLEVKEGVSQLMWYANFKNRKVEFKEEKMEN